MTASRKYPQKVFIVFISTFILALILSMDVIAQIEPVLRDRRNNIPAERRNQDGTAKDTTGFQRRNDAADSITISYRLLDSIRSNTLDSTLNEFQSYFPIPANYIHLGNNGSPAYPVQFTPILKAGWDHGFHQFDANKLNFQNTKFYRTTRPFTQAAYQIASGKEQMINILHTQNVNRNWNFGFEYRLVSAPGFFKTQNTNHNNYRLFSNYQGKRKRYAAYLILLGNKLSASENGGIIDVADLADPNNAKRFSINVRLGGDAAFFYNVFSTKVNTGNIYKDFGFLFRQSYDLGQKDSIKINDSTNEFLFFPRLRFQHSLTHSSYNFRFQDTQLNGANAVSDSAYFKNYYDTSIAASGGLSFVVQDNWKVLTNDFVLQQFPEMRNPAQFILAGIRLENYKGVFSAGKQSFHNLVLHGEYRNKTRNRKWDALLHGEYYLNGFNSGDFNASASLLRFINRQLGSISISFQNVNRSPSFNFENASSFSFRENSELKNENITVLGASLENPFLQLGFRNIAITNYTYFKNFYQSEQYSKLINIVQITGSKKFRLTRNLNLYSDVIVQQTDGAAPVRVPVFYSRQRLALEGIYYKNMTYSLGIDARYNLPYKANDYSPVMGQFVPQDSIRISNRPTVHAFFHFRIKTFTALIRLENLNTVDFSDGLSFTRNSLYAPNYPGPGLVFRLGVQWRFVN